MLRRSIVMPASAGAQGSLSYVVATSAARSASALVACGSNQGQPLLFKRNIQKYWSKEARQFKGKRPVKVMSIKRAARLAARDAAAEAEAAHIDAKFGTRCTSAFLADRVRWSENYEGPKIATTQNEESPKKHKRVTPIATPAKKEEEEKKPSFFARLFGRS